MSVCRTGPNVAPRSSAANMSSRNRLGLLIELRLRHPRVPRRNPSILTMGAIDRSGSRPDFFPLDRARPATEIC